MRMGDDRQLYLCLPGGVLARLGPLWPRISQLFQAAQPIYRQVQEASGFRLVLGDDKCANMPAPACLHQRMREQSFGARCWVAHGPVLANEPLALSAGTIKQCEVASFNAAEDKLGALDKACSLLGALKRKVLFDQPFG
ncbi:hypothetical protein CV100_00640 [Stenotrophomonas maltophilia]|nr:hypothetical protein CV100_00640 [Stenotrophomonas maltophilia]